MYPTYKPHRNLHISVYMSIIYNHRKMGDSPFVFQWVNGSGVGGPAIAETLLRNRKDPTVAAHSVDGSQMHRAEGQGCMSPLP